MPFEASQIFALRPPSAESNPSTIVDGRLTQRKCSPQPYTADALEAKMEAKCYGAPGYQATLDYRRPWMLTYLAETPIVGVDSLTA